MSTLPSFRLPFTLPDDVHPAVREAIRYAFNGLVDVNQAIKTLKSQQVPSTSTTTSTTVVEQVAGGGGGGSTTKTIGVVNLQPNPPGNTSYTTQASDYGALILVQSVAPTFTYILNSGLTLPFYTTVFNLGTATINASASIGNINNVASVSVLPNQFAIFYFDGTNWWAAQLILPQTIAKVTSKWLDSYNATTGVFTQSQPAATDINGTGLQAFPNNAAAIAGGLVAGNLYRTGSDPDTICVVH